MMNIQPGMTLTDYASVNVRVARVAAGGMGLVAFGPDSLWDGRWRALKTMRPEYLTGHGRDRFISEALTWQGLWPHSNLMTAQSVTEINGVPFLVLDYAAHGSLRDLLERTGGPLPLPTAVTIAQHLAAGLVALHTPDPEHLRPQPIVHRDLKPDNVLIQEISGVQLVQLTDLGLAKALAGDGGAALAALAGPPPTDPTHTAAFRTQAGILYGTMAYAPPEQWRDAAKVDERADVYALACILGEVFSGRHPVLDLRVRHTADDWQAAHVNGPRGRLPGVVPAYVQDLWEASLDPEPGKRPTAQEVLAGWQRGAGAIREWERYDVPEVVEHTDEHEMIFWQGWAEAYWRFGRVDEARTRIERAYVLAPGHPDVLLSRGVILAAQGDAAGAEAMYRASLAAWPVGDRVGRKMVWNNLGGLYSETQRYAEAEGACAEGLDLMPEAADTWMNRGINQRQWGSNLAGAGQIEAARQHFTLALQYYHEAQRLNPQHSQVTEYIAIAQNALARLGPA